MAEKKFVVLHDAVKLDDSLDGIKTKGSVVAIAEQSLVDRLLGFGAIRPALAEEAALERVEIVESLASAEVFAAAQLREAAEARQQLNIALARIAQLEAENAELRQALEAAQAAAAQSETARQPAGKK
jgi:hypothetical protein